MTAHQATAEGLTPLSFAQDRLWFLNEVEEAATYHVPVAVRLAGHLDTTALRAATDDVVARHESLRTLFPFRYGQPWQQILPAAEVTAPWTEHACTSQQLQNAMARAAEGRFNLAAELPLRVHLFTTGPDDHVLLLTLHHIACDGWSLGPLIRDLSIAYAARCQRAAPAWERLPVQYADYAEWQREMLGDAADASSLAAHQITFWRDRLAGLPEEAGLPLDRPRPAEPTYHGAAVTTSLGSALHSRILDFARTCRSTLFMVAQAVLAATLARLGAGPDIPIGAPVAGRSNEALDELVGFFVNTLVFRVDVAGHPTFRELVERVRETALEAYSHQDLPFERVVREINPPRVFGRHPLFQTMLVVQQDQVAPSFPGLSAEVRPLDLDVAQFDLTLEFTERYRPDGRPNGLLITAKYATDVLDRASVAAVSAGILGLLKSALTDPDVPVIGG